jgi:hypothetical protein
MDGDKNASDLINTRHVFDAFGEMTPQQASNPYLWSYLSMVDFWQYSKWRWGRNMDEGKTDDEIIEGEAATQGESKRSVNIKQRYLCTPSRIGLLRNSLSRLWWYGYLTYDEDNPADPYHLTRLMTSDTDLCQNLVQHKYSMNKTITLGFLEGIKKYIEEGGILLHENERSVIKYINRYGAVTSLDVLSREDIAELIYNYLINDR